MCFVVKMLVGLPENEQGKRCFKIFFFTPYLSVWIFDKDLKPWLKESLIHLTKRKYWNKMQRLLLKVKCF